MRRWPWLGIGCAVLAIATPAMAQAPDIGSDAAPVDAPPKRTGADLRRCLALADRNHPELQIARQKVAMVRAQLLEAYSAPFSQFKMTGGVTLAPTLKGNNVFSPNTDVALTSSLGVAWQVSISGVLPLWTFGKISSLWDAAEANVEVNEAGVEVARDKVRFEVRRAYLGMQFAKDALELLKDAEAQIDKAVKVLEEKVEEAEAEPTDLLKLQTFRAELDVRKAEAERFLRVARAGLRFYTGVPKLKLREEPLAKAPHRLGKLDDYLSAARTHRPEMHMARAGIAAREAQVRLSRARLFPDIGIGLSASLTAAPEIANQINPFAYDPGNYFRYGAALVAQWNLDFVPAVARIQQAEAQLRETQGQGRMATDGVPAEVEGAYAEVVDWDKRLTAYYNAMKTAKRWLVTVQQAIDIGTLEDKELIDPAKAYAEHRANVLKATMEYNLALSKLAQVTGWDAIAPGV
ncbi:MAG: TolC family protein [Polyangiaceae bacterium]